MKLVSMKRSDEAKDDAMECKPCQGDMPDYPWGVRLNLDEEQLSQLGIGPMPTAGAVVLIEAKGMVTGMREEHIDGKLRRGLEIQITELGLDTGGGKTLAERMYPAKDKA
jgi:hypothetical protein